MIPKKKKKDQQLARHLHWILLTGDVNHVQEQPMLASQGANPRDVKPSLGVFGQQVGGLHGGARIHSLCASHASQLNEITICIGTS